MGNPFSSPSTDAGRAEDREESDRWPFAIVMMIATVGLPLISIMTPRLRLQNCPVSLVFQMIRKDNGGRRSPAGLSSVSPTWGSKASVFCFYSYMAGPDPPWERVILVARRAHCKLLALSAVSCAKTAKPIHLPFRLWTRVDRRMHKFNRIRQVAPMCPHGRTRCRHVVE